jgi:hypothetical protein
VLVADPYQDNPYSKDLYYHVPVGRLINAIMLGIVTYDANHADHLERTVMKKIIVVREPKEWNLGVKGFEVVSSKDYLTDPKFASMRNVRVFNLARSYSYQSRGYYVSLLAEARGQKVIPSAKTILDLKSPSIVKVLSRDLDEVIQQQPCRQEQARVHLQHLLRAQCEPQVRQAGARTVQGVPSAVAARPFREDGSREVGTALVKPIPYNDIPEEHLNYVKRIRRGLLRQEALRRCP